MIVLEKNKGKKIPYSVSGTKITFDDDLTINLSKRQEDWDTHIDVCFDENDDLVIGAAAGRSYVAELDIPAREYTESAEDGEQEVSPIPLDMDKVTLTLCAIDDKEVK